MRIRINERRVGIVQRVNNNKEKMKMSGRMGWRRLASVYQVLRPAIISTDCCPAILQHFDLNSMWWVSTNNVQIFTEWSYLGGPLWYCWLHCKSHPRLHPTWSQVKSHYPINGNQVLRRVMSRYMSIHSSQVRTWITISAAENVWKGTVTNW